jgi:hypothetical protein
MLRGGEIWVGRSSRARPRARSPSSSAASRCTDDAANQRRLKRARRESGESIVSY